MAAPFQTPVNEVSFSSLIDEAILATGKPGQLVAAVQFAAVVVRECQALGLFAQDMLEETLPVPSSQTSVMTWTRPARFRSLRTVKYLTANVYPELALPGRKQICKTEYFYAADNYFVFSGAMAGDTIGFATYYWAKRLAYYARVGVSSTLFVGGPYSPRPAYYDQDLEEWMYLQADDTTYANTLGDPTEEEVRRALTTNWMISDWRDLVLSGVKSKIWNAAGDPRGSTEYGVYKSMQKTLQSTATYEGEGF